MGKLLSFSVLTIVLAIIVLPAFVSKGLRPFGGNQAAINQTIVSPAGETMVNILDHNTDQIMKMSLEEYLVGVVAAEMPASFEIEALKAQAVIARTYALHRISEKKDCDQSKNAHICTDHRHCQAWESEEESLSKWDTRKAASYLRKIRQAVQETAGEAVTFNGELIDAVYHADCGGHTEHSEHVWSGASPYLRGVKCPYCEGSRWEHTEHRFPLTSFYSVVLAYIPVLPAGATGSALLPEKASHSPSGRVKTLLLGGEEVSGAQLRSALGLPSTNFTWEISGDEIVFFNKGYGHGVGLCQYGAEGQAQAGKSYREIIKHYYYGVEVNLF